MQKPLLLLLISRLCKKIFDQIFFWYGFFRALSKRELRAYLEECAIIDDVYLNVTGKYFLNDTMFIAGKPFGNRLYTISAQMGMALLTPFGNWWVRWLSGRDPSHVEKAVKSNRQKILDEATNSN